MDLVALVSNVYNYFMHDRKIKKQEAKINDYLLQDLQRQAEENKKALLRAEVTDRGTNPKIAITNTGPAVAKNIRVDGLDKCGTMLIVSNALPRPSLDPQCSIELSCYPDKSSPRTLHIELLWDDESNQNNSQQQVLTF